MLLVALMTALTDEPGETGAAPASGDAARAAESGNAPVADVRLESLQRIPPEIVGAQRDLFRFQAILLPPPAPLAPGAPAAGGAGRSGPAPPPPIPMRFIGLVDAPTPTGRIVYFSDGRGNVFYGREGDTIEGRYRVLKVNADSAELSYLDGRGRQTIRLTGQ